MDKRLDFWSAMELSRKVVTKHWFKFLGLGIVMWLLVCAGLLALVVGVFVMMPLILAATMYAYEDVFGGPTPTPVATGPSGTIVIPALQSKPARAAGTIWTPATKIGLAAVVLVVAVMLLMPLMREHGPFRVIRQASARHARAMAAEQVPLAAPSLPVDESANPAETTTQPALFGLAMEQELTNFAAINLASGRQDSLPPSVTELARGPEKDSVACAWLQLADMDFAFVSAYDGFYGMVRNMTTLPRDSWDKAAPAALVEVLRDSGQDIPAKFGNILHNPTNYTYGFRTRAGLTGLLQVVSTSEGPPSATIRYKFVQPAANQDAATSAVTSAEIRDKLSSRLEAASSMNDVTAKDKPLAAVAADAARVGEIEIAKKALAQMFDPTRRDEAKRETALFLAKRGSRKDAVEMAKSIGDNTIHNQTLAELAQ